MKLLDILRKLGLIRENGIFYIGGSDVLPPPLKGSEELLTLQALEQGDEDARQRLVEHNLPLPVGQVAECLPQNADVHVIFQRPHDQVLVGAENVG